VLCFLKTTNHLIRQVRLRLKSNGIDLLDMCIDELDESTTDEERVHTLDRALKSMVAVGRWSVLQ
jgi:hypothetical protein